MFSFVEISTSNAFLGVNVREVANSENNHPLNVSRPRCVLSPLCVRLPYREPQQVTADSEDVHLAVVARCVTGGRVQSRPA